MGHTLCHKVCDVKNAVSFKLWLAAYPSSFAIGKSRMPFSINFAVQSFINKVFFLVEWVRPRDLFILVIERNKVFDGPGRTQFGLFAVVPGPAFNALQLRL